MFHPLLTALFAFMSVRNVGLLFRHRRPFRFTFFGFWGLLACAHLSSYPELYPAIAAILVVAPWLKWCDPSAILEGPERGGVPAPRYDRGGPHAGVVDLADHQSGEQEDEMDFTIHIANLGPRAVRILIVTQPMADWVAFTERSEAKVAPTLLVEAGVVRDRATVRFTEPLKAGSNASVTFMAIRSTPTRYGYGAGVMHTYLYADNREQWIKFYTTMSPKSAKWAGVL